ncbi:hypothetical protein pipiens_017848 [Culex pipiens pipiens]|uniref:Uncharacterized protein n=1 Tax=Culex pipiens pipiens TaxID=38569 RepID=A0ABD1CEP7_CULPP
MILIPSTKMNLLQELQHLTLSKFLVGNRNAEQFSVPNRVHEQHFQQNQLHRHQPGFSDEGMAEKTMRVKFMIGSRRGVTAATKQQNLLKSILRFPTCKPSVDQS